MKTLLSIYIICCITFLFAQKQSDFIPIKTIDPLASNEDLKQLDSIFSGKRLIGLGESTHGTSEFTTIRHRIFKYLVENHGYNTFFLEADYSACKRVNRYIHGADDYVDSALNKVKFFPWMTREMSELVNWMRQYNFENDNVLNFVGCDMQFFVDDVEELKIKFVHDSSLVSRIEILDSLLYKMRVLDKNNLNQAKEIWKEIEHDLDADRSIDWLMTKQGVRHYLDYYNNSPYNYRDSCMADNIARYIELNPNSKGIFFAQNGHVSKFISTYKNLEPVKKAGFYLTEKFNSKYAAFAFTSNQGYFNVMDYSTKVLPTKTSQVFRKFDKNRSIEESFSETDFQIALLPLSKINLNKRCSITDIGAVVGTVPGFPKTPESMALKASYYDGIFFIRNTTATDLIK